MSYVEKALYQYIKGIFVDGFKVLFSKKYVVYTSIFLASIISTTVLYILQAFQINTAVDLGNLASLFLKIELALALTYFLSGLILARCPIYFWIIPVVILTGGLVVVFYFLPDILNIIPDLSPYFAVIFYLSWIVLSVFLSFSLSRNFFGNKYLGSALFLGKKKNEGGILFSGIVFVVALVNLALSVYLLRLSIMSLFTPNKQFFLLVASVASIISTTIIFAIIFKLGTYDDVFYTIIAFYYVFTSYILWKLAYYYFTSSDIGEITVSNVDVIISVFTSLFWAIYSMSSYGRKIIQIKALDEELEKTEKIIKQETLEEQKEFERIKSMKIPQIKITDDDSWLEKRKKIQQMKKAEKEKLKALKKFNKKREKRKKLAQVRLEEAKKETEERIAKSKEKWFIFRIPDLLGPDGVLLTIMGMILGYHVTNIQFLSQEDLFSSIYYLSSDRLFGLRDKFAIVSIMVIIVIFLISYETSEKFRKYASPELYRLEILPSFDELMELIEKVRTGEVSWQSIAKDIILSGAKAAVGAAATKAFITPSKTIARKFKKLISRDEEG
ncbi:MAG: hypothetical protein K9W45_05785 [Candidatus Heimdallarchaeum aukensis]|uniref:Uncharacterized protein n=1 Tax=Candidatus Heimdallarchaeum aukensis TaxID=2876573 RepID=A0A9Y1BPG6_9ARCH|nr:MAG: hypothetical protein K9W45_05785 [Candidatus Heimdallarchaeum aukensis]